MSRLGDLGGRLYRGEVSIDFVGRRKLWYTISGCILVIAIVALAVRGLNFSVDFKGGSIFTVTAPQRHHQPGRAGGRRRRRRHVHRAARPASATRRSGRSRPRRCRSPRPRRSRTTLASELHISQSQISTDVRRPDLGQPDLAQGPRGADRVPHRDRGLPVDRVRVEDGRRGPRRAAPRHRDHGRRLRLAGFQVSPATVTGLLTILGYSLYDTVVVFDKVREKRPA